MFIQDIIDQKNKGCDLSFEEISLLVSKYQSGEISDGKMLEFMKLIDEKNFSYDETYYLADALARTGKILEISKEVGFVVDKDSAGSYSDATSLIFMSVLASLKIKNIKSVSSVYGNSNNTLDRLKLFTGFDARVTKDKLVEILNKTHAGFIDEEMQIAPIDKRLFALEKKYNVSSIPLIVASILSRKIAMGASAIVFDVKTGEGAMFKSQEYAQTLATYLVECGKRAGFVCSSLISNLDEPLGSSLGLQSEIQETLSILRSEKSLYASKLLSVAKELVINAIMLFSDQISREKASSMFDQAISSGLALKKFYEIIGEYGGEYLDFKHTSTKLLNNVAISYLCATKKGYVNDIVISEVYEALNKFANNPSAEEDKNANFVLLVGEGQKVFEGDKLVRIFYSYDNKNISSAIKTLKDAIRIEDKRVVPKKTLYKVII